MTDFNQAPQQTFEDPQQIPEQPNLLERIHNLGNTVVEAAQDFYHENKYRAATLLATGAAALGGTMALEAAPAGASEHRAASCERYAEESVTPSYVNKAVLPLAKEVVSVYHHAKPSQKHRKNNTSEMYDNSYQHVTELDVYIPVKLANKHHEGTYELVADFKGRIIPKDMVAVEVAEYPGLYGQNVSSTYDFVLDKSKRNGPSNDVGIHWEATLSYSSKQKGYGFMQSKLQNGEEVGTSLSMTAPILKADTNQAIYQLKRAAKHQSIKRPRDLAASQKLVKICY